MTPASTDGIGSFKVPPSDPTRPRPKSRELPKEPLNIMRRPLDLPPMVNIKAGQKPPPWRGPGHDRTGALSEGVAAAPGDLPGRSPEPSRMNALAEPSQNGSSESAEARNTGPGSSRSTGEMTPEATDGGALAGSDQGGFERLKRAIDEAGMGMAE